MKTIKRPAKKRGRGKRSFDLSFRPRVYWRASKSASNRGSTTSAEVVLARIEVSSGQDDVITLRAKRDADRRIRYRMVHEAALGRASHVIRLRPRSSDRLLTFGELIALLDCAYYDGACIDSRDQERFGGVVWGTLQLHFDHGLEHADDYLFFTTLTSDHYPQLNAYYLERLSEWCLKHCIEADNCRKVVRLRSRRDGA